MSHDTSSMAPGVSALLALEDRNATVIAAIVGHYVGLAEQLRLLTEALLAAVSAGTYVAERGHLLDWYSGELMPHVEAEEAALYGIGADFEPTRLLVLGMVAEHRYLAALIGELEEARGPIEVVAAAAAAHELFRAHLGKESDLLLPALDATGMDLGVALGQMPKIHGGWTVLADQGSLGCGCGAGPADAGAATTFDISPAARPGELDVRALPQGGRYDVICATLDGLGEGESVVIVNDHDPTLFRYQTEAIWPDRFNWHVLEGPEMWHVRIGRPVAS